MSSKVLILGATGRFGRHTAEAFWNAGWQVRTFDRKKDDLISAATGVDVIVNGWNPPYTAWARDVPGLTAQVIDAARTSGATVIIPGNVYGYGAGAPGDLTRGTPMAAKNPLGRVRIEMEDAYRASGVKTIVLRAGDYIDTEASGNWFDLVITAKLKKGLIVAPGKADVPHAWAYLPDVARAAVDLAEKRDGLATFEEVLFPGYTLSLAELKGQIEEATGQALRLKRMNWLPLWCLAPVWPMARNLLEMRYLWSMPHRLDGADMARLLPEFRATDPVTALKMALQSQPRPPASETFKVSDPISSKEIGPLGNQKVDPDKPMSRGTLNLTAE